MNIGKKGFTLVELVVVIMILGILAAIAAPKLLSMGRSATDNSLRQTLGTVRNAIEHYVAEHEGALPPCTGTGDDFQTALAPYIRGEFPASPVGAKTATIKPVTGANTTSDGTTGWMYNTDDGTFIANTDDVANDGVATYDSF